MQLHIIEELAQRYPQLMLDTAEGMSTSRLYRAVVLKGMEYGRKPDFTYAGADSLEYMDTPAGRAEVLFLSVRADFEHCVQKLAYRCEPKAVPPNMGAVTIRGLINWKKIRANQQEYRDTLIVTGDGYYSGLAPQKAGMEHKDWLQVSRTIRTYHELAHFISGRMYQDNKEYLRDEVIADAIGLTAALQSYDETLAKRLLGIEADSYRTGGRLENYVVPEQLEAEAKRAKDIIAKTADVLSHTVNQEPFAVLCLLEKSKTGI